MIRYMAKHAHSANTDAFTFDLRGSGRSERAGCLLSQAEMPGSDGGVQITDQERVHCLAEWEPTRRFFTLDESARDIFRLIAQLRSPAQFENRLATGLIYLYGYGFSSLVVQRALQMYDTEGWRDKVDNLSGIILDSPFPTADDSRFQMERFTLAEVDLHFNEMGFQLLDLCHRDDECSNHFMDEKSDIKIDPEVLINTLFEDLYSKNWCPAVTTHFCDSCFREILGWMLRDRVRRQMIPAFLHRLRRCNEAANGDVTTALRVIEQWRNIVRQGDPTSVVPSLDSTMMMWQGMYNEMMHVPPLNGSEIEKRFLSTRFADKGGVDTILDAATWPLYEQSPYFNQTVTLPEGIHVLVMSGELDVISPPPYGKSIYDSLTAQLNSQDNDAQVYFVTFPTVANFVLENAIKRNDGDFCGVIIMSQFIGDPNDLDRGCAHDFFTPPDFNGDLSMNQLMFGADNIWEGIYEAADAWPHINLWTFVGVELATVVFFTMILGAILYWVILLKLKVRKQNKLLANGEFDEIDFMFSKSRSQLVEDVL